VSCESRSRKRSAVDKADANGEVCDSMEARIKLISRVHSGEITLKQAQEMLKIIKREGKRNGTPTRNQVWNRS